MAKPLTRASTEQCQVPVVQLLHIAWGPKLTSMAKSAIKTAKQDSIAYS